jgi:hypothetical protein
MTDYVQYSTRELLDAIRYENPPTMFLLEEVIGNRIQRHASTKIEVDVVRGGQRVAAYVSRRGDPEDVAKLGYDSKIHVMPYTRQRMILTPEDLEERLPGMTIYETGTPDSRRDEAVGGFLRELDQRVIRLEELQVAEALTSGTCTVSGDGVSYTVTYGRNGSNTATLSGADLWSASTADIKGDIRAAAAQMRSVGAGAPTDMILGATAAGYYIDAVATMLDVRRINAGEINFEYNAQRQVTYLGIHRDVGINVNVWVYSGTYVNSSGVETPYIAASDAILFKRGLEAKAHYSMISNFHSGNFVGRRFPRMYIPDSGDRMVVTLESGPLMAVHEIDATYCIHTAG